MMKGNFNVTGASNMTVTHACPSLNPKKPLVAKAASLNDLNFWRLNNRATG